MSRFLNQRQNRFDNYREITAKFDSQAACGHPVKKGDTIGYHRLHGVQCPDCWARWVAENREADDVENGYINSPW